MENDTIFSFGFQIKLKGETPSAIQFRLPSDPCTAFSQSLLVIGDVSEGVRKAIFVAL